MISFRGLHTMGRLLGLLALVAGLLASRAVGAALAQEPGWHPRDIAMFDEEAGKAATLTRDEEGSDDRSHWVHRRWERDRDSEDVGVGPIITHNTVWVAKDEAAARAIFREQAEKQKEFPESVDEHAGTFEWKIDPIGDEVAALSACIKDACNVDGAINLHQRVVVRKGRVVSVVYIFGRERRSTREATLYFVNKVVERM